MEAQTVAKVFLQEQIQSTRSLPTPGQIYDFMSGGSVD